MCAVQSISVYDNHHTKLCVLSHQYLSMTIILPSYVCCPINIYDNHLTKLCVLSHQYLSMTIISPIYLCCPINIYIYDNHITNLSHSSMGLRGSFMVWAERLRYALKLNKKKRQKTNNQIEHSHRAKPRESDKSAFLGILIGPIPTYVSFSTPRGASQGSDKYVSEWKKSSENTCTRACLEDHSKCLDCATAPGFD